MPLMDLIIDRDVFLSSAISLPHSVSVYTVCLIDPDPDTTDSNADQASCVYKEFGYYNVFMC